MFFFGGGDLYQLLRLDNLVKSISAVANDTSNNGSEMFFHYYYIAAGSAIFVLVVAISVIFGRVFCRRKANKPKRLDLIFS